MAVTTDQPNFQAVTKQAKKNMLQILKKKHTYG